MEINEKNMTKEEKELVIKDLCGRLPYGVIVQVNDGLKGIYDRRLVQVFCDRVSCSVNVCNPLKECICIDSVKPYLRTMDSMTEEEKEELRKEQIKDEQLFADCIKNHPEMRGKVIPHFAADWCNKHHFNYRLPEHLFITVTETNNPYKA